MSVRILGKITRNCEFDHESHGEIFYRFYISIMRPNGAIDTLPVIAPQHLIDNEVDYTDYYFCIDGDVRSHRDQDNHLDIYVLAQNITYAEQENINICNLAGTICTKPNHRVTTKGKQITDFTLAINRKYNKSDYIPCICWDSLSNLVKNKKVGDELSATGRLQSREIENGKYVYEFSIGWIQGH